MAILAVYKILYKKKIVSLTLLFEKKINYFFNVYADMANQIYY